MNKLQPEQKQEEKKNNQIIWDWLAYKTTPPLLQNQNAVCLKCES